MDFRRLTLATCAEAEGAVVVIDVLRAFSTAAYAFAAGARGILPSCGVEEALTLRERFPGALLMGEVGGFPVQGFDFGNSPQELAARDLKGYLLIQRTSAGTQGIVRSTRATTLLASSLVCARATARFIRQLDIPRVTFVITGVDAGEKLGNGQANGGDEDAACVDYIEALLRGHNADPAEFVRRVRESPAGLNLANPVLPPSLANDLDYCVAVDRFDFAMPVSQREGLLVMAKIEQPK